MLPVCSVASAGIRWTGRSRVFRGTGIFTAKRTTTGEYKTATAIKQFRFRMCSNGTETLEKSG